jgi:hydroxyethylthiazole kinase-like sugar kinase family protein
MAPTKWITAVLAGCLSSSVIAAPTATTDNLIVKRASINDVSFFSKCHEFAHSSH